MRNKPGFLQRREMRRSGHARGGEVARLDPTPLVGIYARTAFFANDVECAAMVYNLAWLGSDDRTFGLDE